MNNFGSCPEVVHWWCKQRRNSGLIAFVFIIFFTIVLGIAIVSTWKTSQINNANVYNGAIIILVIMFFVFLCISLSILKSVIVRLKK